MSSALSTDVLVVAAHPPELAGLHALLGEQLHGRVGALSVVGEAVGIGLVAAAEGTVAAVRAHSPRCVVLVGTCGVYESRAANLALNQVVTASRIRLASTAVVERRGAFPGPMLIAVDPDAALSRGIASDGLARVGVATTLAITTDDGLARHVASSLECEVEHLEAFAVVAACARQRVPVAVVLGVANRVGSRAREEWLHHHEVAGNGATDVVAAWLRRGAPGAVRT